MPPTHFDIEKGKKKNWKERMNDITRRMFNDENDIRRRERGPKKKWEILICSNENNRRLFYLFFFALTSQLWMKKSLFLHAHLNSSAHLTDRSDESWKIIYEGIFFSRFSASKRPLKAASLRLLSIKTPKILFLRISEILNETYDRVQLASSELSLQSLSPSVGRQD